MSFLDDFVARLSGPGVGVSDLDKLSAQQRLALDLNAIGTGVGVGGTALSVINSIMGGQRAAGAAAFAADQLRQAGGQAQARAQREAIDVDRQEQYMASSALAAAAASGGGASDPTVVNLIAANAGEFAYRKAVALYAGDEAARVANLQADVATYEGKAAKRTGLVNGLVGSFGGGMTILNGMARAQSMYERFSGGGPLLPDERR